MTNLSTSSSVRTFFSGISRPLSNLKLSITDRLIHVAKRVPIDLGQGNLRLTTKGKLIALSMIETVPESNKGKIKALDIGCREGYQSMWLESKGYDVTAVDLCKIYEKCQIVDVDEPLPFEENSFDLIWCSEVIEHLKDPTKSVSEFRRILKPGGKMVITTPNSYFWMMRILHLFGLSPKRLQNPDHLHFFNEKDIKQLFPKANLYGFFPYIFVKYTIKSAIGFLSPTFVMEEKKEK